MEDNINTSQSAYVQDDDFYHKKTKSVPKPPLDIGINYQGGLYDNIITGGQNGGLDISLIESFTSISQSRDTVYSLLDTMSEDPTVAAVLETYAEDATEENDEGRIIWCQADNQDVLKYVNFLLDSLNVDKNVYRWVFSLIKYGDVYLRLYRQSEIEEEEAENKRDTLNEDVKLIAYSNSDRYSHYVEMCPNPAEIFELTRFGKSYAYIEAPVAANTQKVDTLYNQYYRYSFNRADVKLYDATAFVHASLQDNSTRTPEEVELFKEETDFDGNVKSESKVYTVNRGQSILYNSFKIWREMMLLENALLLNRLTKSSIARIIGVEVGDMPKEEVPNKLMSVKQLFEQKAALNAGNSMAEYTNPGPMENNVYIPTHGGIGNISIQQVGGDVDVKGLGDIDFFKTKFYSGLRIPKQYLGDTDDATGFNGGTALTIVSSRYAKAVKRIQSTIIQAVTDMINLMLIDRHMESYINKFVIKMVPPTTQEEIDRREAIANRINTISDIMNLVSEVEDASAKLRILKSLLSDVISDEELNTVLQEQIDKLQEEEEQGEDTTPENAVSGSEEGGDNDFNFNFGGGGGGGGPDLDIGGEDFGGEEGSAEGSTEGGGEEILPTPADLGAGDFTDANMEI